MIGRMILMKKESLLIKVGSKMFKLILMIVISYTSLGTGVNALASTNYDSPFIKRKAEGWFWYEDKEKQKNKNNQNSQQLTQEYKEAQQNREKQEYQKNMTPTEIINQNKQILEASLHKAILDPSYNNVKHYMELQKAVVARSEAFSEKWQEVVYKEPTLNEEVNYSTSHSAVPIHYAEQKAKKEQKLREIAGDFGLLYFFKSDCPYCQKFSSLAKSFSEKYGFEILGVSLDGNVVSEFPDAVPDNGVSKKLKITTYPTLVAVNERTEEMIPITYGYTSETDLENTLYFLANVKSKKRSKYNG